MISAYSYDILITWQRLSISQNRYPAAFANVIQPGKLLKLIILVYHNSSRIDERLTATMIRLFTLCASANFGPPVGHVMYTLIRMLLLHPFTVVSITTVDIFFETRPKMIQIGK